MRSWPSSATTCTDEKKRSVHETPGTQHHCHRSTDHRPAQHPAGAFAGSLSAFAGRRRRIRRVRQNRVPPTANPPTPSSRPSYGRIEETCQIRKKEGNECSRSAGARAPRRRASRMSDPCRWHIGKSQSYVAVAHISEAAQRVSSGSSCKYSGSQFDGHPSRRSLIAHLSHPSIVRSADRVVINRAKTCGFTKYR